MKPLFLKICVGLLAAGAGLFMPLNASAAGVANFNRDTAYRMAVACDCTYHIVDAYWSIGSALKCLTNPDNGVPDFTRLSEDDVVSWSKPGALGQRDYDAYVLIRTEKELILALRGTQPPIRDDNRRINLSTTKDWLNNFNFPPTDDGYHRGFLASWNNTVENLVNNPDAKRLLDDLGERQFMVTGHSKAGALAIIAAIKMHDGGDAWPLPLASEIYAFEGARPVTEATRTKYAGKLANLKRFEYKADIVPLVPPGAWLAAKRDEYPILRYLFSAIFPVRFDSAAFNSAGLGTLYFVNAKSELVNEPDDKVLNQQLAAVVKAYTNWRYNVFTSINNGQIPFCRTLAKNHVTYLGYLRRYDPEKGLPAPGDEITTYWDKFCDINTLVR